MQTHSLAAGLGPKSRALSKSAEGPAEGLHCAAACILSKQWKSSCCGCRLRRREEIRINLILCSRLVWVQRFGMFGTPNPAARFSGEENSEFGSSGAGSWKLRGSGFFQSGATGTGGFEGTILVV